MPLVNFFVTLFTVLQQGKIPQLFRDIFLKF